MGDLGPGGLGVGGAAGAIPSSRPFNPNLPWGDGFNVAATNTVNISMTHDASNWTSTVGFSTHSVKNSFPLGNKNFNQAILAIELTGVSWDFGELVWENVTMVMNTTQTAWCTRNNEHNTDEIRAPENYNSATKYTSTGGKTTVSGGEVTCTIDKVVMQGPAKSSNAEFEIL
ncbi:hypothetical protein EG329_002613 [Mollisiaceae sp. DMI_Dod_QoI]|nr:hypothetical protein EG329_002613 [Helotiales sp. DMI_Dod_QoI]